MATAPAQRITDLTGADLQNVLELVKGSDTVELKLTVPADTVRTAVTGLELDPLDAQVRQVFFFDTPDLTLNQAGLVVRARRVQGRNADSVIKLRPVVPESLSPEVRMSPNVGVELDAMPGGYVCSASMKARLDNAQVHLAAHGRLPLRKLFTKEQRSFYKTHAPEGLGLDDLTVLGPIFVLKLKSSPNGFGRRAVTELWFYPDGERILELSTKCAPGEMFQVAVEGRALLEKRGIDLSAEQQTKTKTALEYFSKEARETT